MPSDQKISSAKLLQQKTINTSTVSEKMPLLTLDPNKPKLQNLGVTPNRSPNKRSTPPQSPPTPHKIELIEDSECHRRLLRSSQNNVSDKQNGSTSPASNYSASTSSSSSTSSDEGLRTSSRIVKKNLFNGNHHYFSVKSNGLTNGSSSSLRVSPRKHESPIKHFLNGQYHNTDATSRVIDLPTTNGANNVEKVEIQDSKIDSTINFNAATTATKEDNKGPKKK